MSQSSFARLFCGSLLPFCMFFVGCGEFSDDVAISSPKASTAALYPAEFSWQKFPGDPVRSLPAGNYLTPNMYQCSSGCNLWAMVGTLQMQFKIDHADPALSIAFDPWEYDGECGSCAGAAFERGCLLNRLKNEGITRTGSTIKYKIGGSTDISGLENRLTDLQYLHDQLVQGPIFTTAWASPSTGLSDCANSYLVPHALIIVGYRVTSSGAIEVETKNSWANIDGKWGTEWTEVYPTNLCTIGAYESHRLTGTFATDVVSDADNDGVFDYLDLCLDELEHCTSTDCSSTNVDGDFFGDVCDVDADDDGVLNIHDCAPLNKALALDADGDGVCDEYNESSCIINTIHPQSCNGASYACEEWSYDRVTCRSECERVAAIESRHPIYFADDGYLEGPFDLDGCYHACRLDNCYATPEVPSDVNDACRRVERCTKQEFSWQPGAQQPCSLDCDASVVLNGQTYRAPSEADLDACSLWHANPDQLRTGMQSIERGDFCYPFTSMVMVKNLTLTVGTHRDPNRFGRCYNDEYEISFERWGRSGEMPDVSIDACFCPLPPEAWDRGDCEAYCPTAHGLSESLELACPSESSKFADPNVYQDEFHPSDLAEASACTNRAWDPISSPQDCASSVDEYDLCRDLTLDFMSYDYGSSVYKSTYRWAWQQSYEPDVEDPPGSGQYAEKDYSVTPGSVKIRIAWDVEVDNPDYEANGCDGEFPCQTCGCETIPPKVIAKRKTFLASAVELKSGCFLDTRMPHLRAPVEIRFAR